MSGILRSRLRRGVASVAVVALGLGFGASAAAVENPDPGGGGSLGYSIAEKAKSQVGGTCATYGFCWAEWCSLFAKWVWQNAGVTDVGGLNEDAISFYRYGETHGTLSRVAHVGDVVVWGPNTSWASHVQVVVAVSADGTKIQTVGGNEGNDDKNLSTVQFDDWFSWSTHGSFLSFVSPGGSAHLVADPSPAMALNRDGRLEAFKVFADGHLWHKWQTAANGNWSAWADLGGYQLSGEVAATTNADGRVEVFVIGGNGQLYHMWQQSPGANWSGFAGMGGSSLRKVAVGRNYDGRLEVFVIGGDERLYHLWQGSPGADWSGFDGGLGGTGLRAVAVGRNDDGRLEVFAIIGGQLHHRWQQSPGADWSGWAGMGGSELKSGVAVAGNADGRLEAFVTNRDGQLLNTWQTAKNGGWVSGFGNLGGSGLAGGVAAGSNLDGRIEVTVTGGDGYLYHRWQSTPNGSWSANWVLL